MRFWTIWTIPAMTLGERLSRTRDCLAMAIGRRLPLRIRFWVTMQEIGKATSNSPNVPMTALQEILKELDIPKSMS